MQLITNSIHNDFQLKYFDELKSTNDFAWNLISNSNPNQNLVIITGNQTEGKGQYDRSWHADPNKNVTMSVIMSPSNLLLKKAFYLNILASVSILRAIQKLTGIMLNIKWPNDIYFKEKKLGGILIKNKVIQNHIRYTVIGIGINVNQLTFLPSLLNPISIKNILSQETSISALIKGILDELRESIESLRSGKINELHLYYVDHLFGKDQERTFKINGKNRIMTIKNVLPEGRINLTDENNILHSMTSGLEYILVDDSFSPEHSHNI